MRYIKDTYTLMHIHIHTANQVSFYKHLNDNNLGFNTSSPSTNKIYLLDKTLQSAMLKCVMKSCFIPLQALGEEAKGMHGYVIKIGKAKKAG